MLLFKFGTWPRAIREARNRSSISSFCCISFAARNRRERCWFILARGATPSTAIYRSRRGRAAAISRSIYLKINSNIWSSHSGRMVSSSPCVQLWTMLHCVVVRVRAGRAWCVSALFLDELGCLKNQTWLKSSWDSIRFPLICGLWCGGVVLMWWNSDVV